MKIQELSPGAVNHLTYLRNYYSKARQSTPLSRYYLTLLAHRYNLLIPKDATALEIGCGSGDLLNLIHCENKAGVDLSPDQVRRAREKYPLLTISEGVGETGPLPDRKYDFIILSDVLNEAADVEALLRMIHSCSHAGTRLVINIYNTLWRPLLTFARALAACRTFPSHTA